MGLNLIARICILSGKQIRFATPSILQNEGPLLPRQRMCKLKTIIVFLFEMGLGTEAPGIPVRKLSRSFLKQVLSKVQEDQ
jgi:hypothetical protein